MARVTVEDCVVKVPNRFDLVMLAAQRAREVVAGAPLTVDRDDDKNAVVALREIADETVSLDHLQNALIQGLQKHVEVDEIEEEEQVEFDITSLTMAPGTDILATEATETAEEDDAEAADEAGESDETVAAGDLEADDEDS